jgi:hypothetical protein
MSISDPPTVQDWMVYVLVAVPVGGMAYFFWFVSHV